MFDMVIHAAVEKAKNGTQFDGTGVQAMVANVLGQPGMLSQRKDLVQPATVEPSKRKEQDREPTAYGDRPGHHSCIHEQIETGPPEHFSPLTGRHKLFRFPGRHSRCVHKHRPHHLDGIRDPEEVKQDPLKVGGAHYLDLRLYAKHDGLTGLPGMAPASKRTLLHI